MEGIADIQGKIGALAAAGDEYHALLEADFPRRRFFAKPPGIAAPWHLLAVEVGGAFWQHHLALRDLLREDQALCAAYQALKAALAARYRADRQGDTEANSAFIEAAIRRSALAVGTMGGQGAGDSHEGR